MVELVRWHSDGEETDGFASFTYYLTEAKSRKALVADFQLAISSAFREYEATGTANSSVLDQKESLCSALSEVREGDPVVLVLRHVELRTALQQAVSALMSLPPFTSPDNSFMGNRRLNRAFKTASSKLRGVVNSPVGISELAKGSALINDVAEGKVDKEDSQFVFVVTPDSFLRTVWKHFGSKDRQAKMDEGTKVTEELLLTFSPDLLKAYHDARKLAWKVQKADHIAPEDMLLLEQATKDYIPRMFKALKKAGARTDSPHWQAVVQECVTQFQLIETGLQNMMEGNVLREVSAMKSQTELLRSRVARTAPALNLNLNNSTAFAGLLKGNDN